GVGGIVADQRIGIGKADDALDPRGIKSRIEERPAARIGAVRGEFPVGISIAAEIRAIGMPADREAVRQIRDGAGNHLEQRPDSGRDGGAAALEHALVKLIDDLDAQSLRRHVDHDMIAKARKLGVGIDCLADCLARLLEAHLLNLAEPGEQLGLFHLAHLRLRLALVFTTAFRRLDARDDGRDAEVGDLRSFRLQAAPAEVAAGAGLAEARGGRREIFGKPLLLLRRCYVEQPEQQEKRHHRGYKVGVGDLPRAAVMAMAAFLDLLDDYRGDIIGHGISLLTRGTSAPAYTDGAALQASSTSRKVGRSWL